MFARNPGRYASAVSGGRRDASSRRIGLFAAIRMAARTSASAPIRITTYKFP